MKPTKPTVPSRGVIQPKPAGSAPPRPDLLPVQLRGVVGQPKASPSRPGSLRPKPLPGLGPQRALGPARIAQPRVAARPSVVRARGGKPTLASQRGAGTRGASTVQRAAAAAAPDDSDTKVRAPVAALYSAVSDYDTKMAFSAHWMWWEKDVCKVLPIAAEAAAAGLESSSSKHPDQTFWAQKLKARPHKTAAIVTDCKLLPCWKKNHQGCAHALPGIIKARLGAGIPIACFAHAEGTGQRQVFYTTSGDSYAEIDEALKHVYTWEWDDDDEYDPGTY